MWCPTVQVLNEVPPDQTLERRASVGRRLAEIDPDHTTAILPHVSTSTLAIEPRDYARLTTGLEQLMRTLVRIARQDAADGTLADRLGLSDVQRRFAAELASGPLYGCVRFDLLLDPRGPRITEVEAEPDAFLARDFMEQALREQFPRHFPGDSPCHLELFGEALRRMGAPAGRGLILTEPCWLDSLPLRVGQRLLERAGLPSEQRACTEFAADPEALGRYAWVRKGYSIRSMLPHAPQLVEPLSRARLWTSLGFSLLGLKSMLARLWTAVDSGSLSAAEAKSVQTWVPETRMLAAVDDAALEQREDWVLKPAEGTFGHGVSIGRELSPEAWRRALSEARAQPEPWVVQRRIELPVLDMVSPAGSRERLHFDVCPHLIWLDGDVFWGHRLVRLSRTSLMNLGDGDFWMFGVVAEDRR